ncbi:MAG: glycosyltransferase family 4 protein [Crocinitomicaceae bacterium]|nr:glycosyltransferase family 4 protein [Crocinitomicaceae bacterium]
MKVLFVNRNSSFSVPGGDTVQMEGTAKYLRELGITVEIYHKDTKIDYADFQLIHFFNITRPAEILEHTSKSNLPYVVSTIFVDYTFYKVQTPLKPRGIVTRIFGPDGLEYFKTVAKHFLGKEKIPYSKYLFMGQRRSIKSILKNAHCLLPNSASELNRLKKRYGKVGEATVIHNGVDLEKFSPNSEIERIQNQVICVGRIEPMKNQLNLIKSLEKSGLSLKIIGAISPNHVNYFKECQRIASSNVEFIDRVSQEELAVYYQQSEVHVLPSWFETTGLVSLEAAYLGCKIVVSPHGDTKDYFKDEANYCEAKSVDSIKEAILKACEREPSSTLKNWIIEKYNWKQIALETSKVYENILKSMP